MLLTTLNLVDEPYRYGVVRSSLAMSSPEIMENMRAKGVPLHHIPVIPLSGGMIRRPPGRGLLACNRRLIATTERMMYPVK